ERLCDSVGIIAGGRMVATGTVAELRARERHKRLRVVLSEAEPGWADRLPGTIVAKDGDEVILEPDDDQAVLLEAMRLGRVEQFGWVEPKLSEIFREAVA